MVGGAPEDGRVVTSLIPYTFPLLDSRSGYPAGIRDPEWQQAAFESALDGDQLTRRSSELGVAIVAAMRAAGHAAGTVDATELQRVAADPRAAPRARRARPAGAGRGMCRGPHAGRAGRTRSGGRPGDGAGVDRRAARPARAGDATVGSRAARRGGHRPVAAARARRCVGPAAARSAPLGPGSSAPRDAPAARGLWRDVCRIRRDHGPRRRDADPALVRGLATRDGRAGRPRRAPRRHPGAGIGGCPACPARPCPRERWRGRSRPRARPSSGRRPNVGWARWPKSGSGSSARPMSPTPPSLRSSPPSTSWSGSRAVTSRASRPGPRSARSSSRRSPRSCWRRRSAGSTGFAARSASRTPRRSPRWSGGSTTVARSATAASAGRWSGSRSTGHH